MSSVNHYPQSRGFTLVEVLVAATILIVAVVGTGYLFVAGEAGFQEDEWMGAALQEAKRKIEELRGLPPGHPQIQGAPAPGLEHMPLVNPVVLDTRATSDPSDDIRGYLRWIVTHLDDPLNGEGYDYLLVRVEVSRGIDFDPALPRVYLETIFAR